jgi:hypothetical protein
MVVAAMAIDDIYDDDDEGKKRKGSWAAGQLLTP